MQMTSLFLTMWLFLSSVSTTSPTSPTFGDADQIRNVLATQVTDWNAGRLEEFMQGYWNSAELTFFSGSSKLSGWDKTLQRYRNTYQAQGREMGKLVFSDLNVVMLGRDAAVARGHWELTMSDEKKPGGLFTLIFRKFDGKWRIIHDHTSQ